MSAPARTMRDALISRIGERMAGDPSVFFLTADLGAPALDGLRALFPRRCLNVGIAEQNLISAATGLALEGFTVFAYGIAPFVSMRACEQMRSTLAFLAESREVNVNILSLGGGFSYDVSGPSHHCIEDIPLVRLIPGIDLLSPSDPVLAEALGERAFRERRPKYFRLDGKPLPAIHGEGSAVDLDRGFRELRAGGDACLVTTGYATHIGLRVAERMEEAGKPVGLVDLFLLKDFDADGLAAVLSRYGRISTVEESLVRRGGLDSLVLDLLVDRGLAARFRRYGPSDRYIFANRDREGLHRAYGMDAEAILGDLREQLR